MCVHASHPTSESQWRVNLIYTRRRKREGGGEILLSFIVSFRSYCGGKFDIALKRGNKKKKKKTSWIYIGGQTHKTFFLRLPTCRYIDAALFLTSKIVVHPYPPLLLPCCCWNNLLCLFTIFFFFLFFFCCFLIEEWRACTQFENQHKTFRLRWLTSREKKEILEQTEKKIKKDWGI